MNQGIISTLLSFASVFNIFLFAYFFKEKVNAPQIAGVVLMILSVCCMSVRLEQQEEAGDSNYIYWALLIGMIAPCLMSTRHVIIRKFKGNYDAVS